MLKTNDYIDGAIKEFLKNCLSLSPVTRIREYLLIDSTVVRAHACSSGAQKNNAHIAMKFLTDLQPCFYSMSKFSRLMP